jgi:hypothetical protein
MCSYCGCRSITPIDRFSAEHIDQEGDGLFPAAVIALDAAALAEMAGPFSR